MRCFWYREKLRVLMYMLGMRETLHASWSRNAVFSCFADVKMRFSDFLSDHKFYSVFMMPLRYQLFSTRLYPCIHHYYICNRRDENKSPFRVFEILELFFNILLLEILLCFSDTASFLVPLYIHVSIITLFEGIKINRLFGCSKFWNYSLKIFYWSRFYYAFSDTSFLVLIFIC